MDLQTYRRRRQQMLEQAPNYRHLCVQCLQPEFGCYCAHIQSFNPQIKFVILIHPIEMKRRIATGRMSHLCLQNSELIVGQDYSQNKKVNGILTSPDHHPLILYPGRNSLNLSMADPQQKSGLFPENKKPVIFVIDGTWATARKMIRQSQNLIHLPRICFTPPGLSQFRVRKQPAPECYSTIEAIHHTIELIGTAAGFALADRQHDGLLHVFSKMVEKQLEFIRQSYAQPNPNAYRKPRYRVV